jgi:GrpB-like predicted nucleotidyltransferase (UPF0157 family)
LKRNISSKPSEIRQVNLTVHQSSWQDQYEKEASLLKKIFQGEMVEIHHIGSTSIPGMPAKPIIDILMAVQDILKIDQYNSIMQKNGYIPKGENGIPGRQFFIKGTDVNHSHHLHIFQAGSAEINRHLLFRDYLIVHPKEADRYAQLKLKLAKEHSLDIDAYQKGKDAFIKAIDKRAAMWGKKNDHNHPNAKN